MPKAPPKRPTQPLGARSNPTAPWLILTIGIAIGVTIFIISARNLWFTQDDAYISYRYAQNALAGHGLVFNVGERVEGYTNFLWVVWLMLCGSLGIGFDAAAKALGLASGAGMIAFAALLSRRAWQQIDRTWSQWAGAAGAIICGVNGSLAYWAVSGLETALFGLLVTLSLWLFLRQSSLTPVALALATMTRPEGGLVWLMLVGCEYVLGHNLKRTFSLFGITALLLVPLGIFKSTYYGSLLPNPFYAKTGLAWEYVQSGLEYTWLFLQHYMLYGLILIPVGISLWKLPARLKAIPALFIVFAVYIIIIGGDVLRPNRFFVPLIAVMAAAIVAGMAWIAARWRSRVLSLGVSVIVAAALVISSYMIPQDILKSTCSLEKGLTLKMGNIANYLKDIDTQSSTLAVSTIGKVSYDLPGRRVIDMLGLTDSTIARHPETIPGNVSTWKERNFNATYVLSQNPDWILFSTGHKPSAPAERALILHSEFRQNYYTVLFPTPQRMLAIHRRKPGEFAGTDEVWPTIELANQLNAAYNRLVENDLDAALVKLRELKATGPTDYVAPDAFLANLFLQKKQIDSALHYANVGLAIDSFCVTCWQVRGNISIATGDSLMRQDADRHLKTLCPWMNFE